MVKFLGASEGRQGKREQGKDANLQHKVSFALDPNDVADFSYGDSACLEQIGHRDRRTTMMDKMERDVEMLVVKTVDDDEVLIDAL